jgi:hypothetical protein
VLGVHRRQVRRGGAAHLDAVQAQERVERLGEVRVDGDRA